MTKPRRIDVRAAEARRPASSCGRLVELSVLAEPERTASWIKPDSADLFGSPEIDGREWGGGGGDAGGIESNRVPTTVEVECAEFFSHPVMENYSATRNTCLVCMTCSNKQVRVSFVH